MSTATVGTAGVGPGAQGPDRQAAPALRRLPVPISQPRPALRVVRDDPGDVPAAQGVLALGLPDDAPRPEPVDVTPLGMAETATEPGGGTLDPTAANRTAANRTAANRTAADSDPISGPGARPTPADARPASARPASARPASARPAGTTAPRATAPRRTAAAEPEAGEPTAAGPGTIAGTVPGGFARDGVAQPRVVGAALPDPGPWAGQFVQAALEVASGLRPVTQLIRWTNEDVRAMLGRRAALARRPGARERQSRRCTVRSTRACLPRDGVAEASVVIADGERFRAVAVRLEASDGRWRVTALRIG